MMDTRYLTLAVLCLGCVLLLHAAAAPAVPTTMGTVTPPPRGAVCRLHLEGLGSQPGFKKAHLSCTGGTVSAAAHPLLQAAFGPGSSTGVVWTKNPVCQQALKAYGCLLVICSGPATFFSPVITGFKSPFQQGGTAVCIDVATIDDGHVWLVNGTFTHNEGLRPLAIRNEHTRVYIKHSKFVGNDVRPHSMDGGAVAVSEDAKLLIQSSTFVGNAADLGGAIDVTSAQVDIISEGNLTKGLYSNMFQGNAAAVAGGVLSVGGIGHVRIYSSHFKDSSAQSYGGSILAVDEAVITMVNSAITNSTIEPADEGDGGGNSFEGGRLEVVDSIIQDCVAECPKCTGGAINAGGNATVLLTNSLLVNNSARMTGGGLYAGDTTKITLQRTVFTHNKAQYGGGLAFYENASLALVGVSRVEGGHATDCGGGVLLGSDKIAAGTLLGNGSLLQATSNTATYSADICVRALNIKLVSSNSSLDNFITSIGSDDGLLHVIFNVSGPQGVPSNDAVAISVFNSHNTTVATDVLRGQIVNGLRHIAVKLKQPPGSYRLHFGILDDPDVTPAKLQLRIVSCRVGYMTASSGDACSLCVRGYFSFDPADKECTMCVPDAVCPGGAELWPAGGFWHSAPQSVQMHRCINPSACLGSAALQEAAVMNTSNATAPVGADYKTAQCAQAYEGNLCADCKRGYGKSRPFQCRRCLGQATIVVLYLAAALAIMGLIRLLMYLRTSSGSSHRNSLQDPLPEELLKVLVLHGQWLFIISNLVGIPWPATLMAPLQVISGLWSSSSGSSIGLDCILPRNTAIPVAVQMVLLRLFTPVTVLCMMLAGKGVLHRIRPATHAGARHQLASLVITVVFLFLPMWLSTAFSLFTCIQLDRPASWPYQAEAVGAYWVEDMRQQCYSSMGYHRAWALGLGTPLVLLMCLLLPAGVFAFMWHSRKQGMLTDPVFDQHYGFMYQLWREDVCWWEAVVVLQTIGLVMISTLGFALDSHYQVLLTLAVLGVIVVLLLWVRPFKCRAANTVAVQSACVLLLTAYTALTFLPFNRREAGPVYGNIMGVVLLLLNVLFLVRTGWKLALSLDWSAVREWLASKLEGVFGLKLRGKAAGKSGREGPPAESKDAAAAVAS